MKEPGQMAYEAWVKAYGGTSIPWDKLGDDERDEWAAVESAIRADEAAKVWEEAAKAVEAMIDKDASDRGDRADMALLDAAAALRAKIGTEHD